MTATLKKLAAGLGSAGVVAVCVLYVESKASSARADGLERRMQSIELEVASDRVDRAWIKASLSAIAARVGAAVPPPP